MDVWLWFKLREHETSGRNCSNSPEGIIWPQVYFPYFLKCVIACGTSVWHLLCGFKWSRLQVLSEEEKGSTAGQEDEEWEKALSVERFGDIITESAINGADKMGRSYNEKDFECKYCLMRNSPQLYVHSIFNNSGVDNLNVMLV